MAPFQEAHFCPLLSRFIRRNDDYRKPRPRSPALSLSSSSHLHPGPLNTPAALFLSLPLFPPVYSRVPVSACISRLARVIAAPRTRSFSSGQFERAFRVIHRTDFHGARFAGPRITPAIRMENSCFCPSPVESRTLPHGWRKLRRGRFICFYASRCSGMNRLTEQRACAYNAFVSMLRRGWDSRLNEHCVGQWIAN